LSELSLKTLAEKWLGRIIPLLPPGERHRTGGVLADLVTKSSPDEDLTVCVAGIEVGTPNPEKRLRYHYFAGEKCLRLYAHPHHRLSHQSMNEEMEHYQGAVRTRNGIRSFSGLPAYADEALAFAVSIENGDMTALDALEDSTDSNNQFFMELTKHYPELKAA
jgi:hypothetical protein